MHRQRLGGCGMRLGRWNEREAQPLYSSCAGGIDIIIIIISFAIRQFQMNPTKPSFDVTILYSYRDVELILLWRVACALVWRALQAACYRCLFFAL